MPHITYEKAYNTLLERLRNKNFWTPQAITRHLYLVILLTILRNGINVTEAVELLKEAIESGKREAIINKGGKKKRVVLPEEISEWDLKYVEKMFNYKLKKGKYVFSTNISIWTKNNLGLSVHDLIKARKEYPHKNRGGDVVRTQFFRA
ncbi:hypothetical protein DRN38_01715 [Thermococci archaeon]|nr:MAG: hypothetical protein DRN38_01715 [Thermococci archaeon]